MASPSLLVSALPQPHAPGAVLLASLSHWSVQSGMASPSALVSGTPQPQLPAVVLAGSSGQPSVQLGIASPSVLVSGTPQPHVPAAVLVASAGQASLQSGVPSWSPSALQFGSGQTLGSGVVPSRVVSKMSSSALSVARTASSPAQS